MIKSDNKSWVMITGASKGIGRALADRYLEMGHRVISIGRDFTHVMNRENEIQLSLDLSKRENIKKLIALVRENQWQIAILMNNAAIQSSYYVNERTKSNFNDESSRAEVAINLLAPIELVEGLFPYLTTNAVIANTTSLVAYQPKPSAAIYSASKAALHSYTKSLRYQLSSTNVHVTEIVPPLVETNMTEHQKRKKMLPADMAKYIQEGIEQRKKIIAPGMSQFVLKLNIWMPGLVEKILMKE